MAAALIPMGLMAASAIPNLISGIMGIANQAKQLRGGRLGHRIGKRHRGGKLHRKKHYRKKGRGVVADTLGGIPLLGALLGPIAKAFGGKLRRLPRRRRVRGYGLSPMYMQRPYTLSHHGHGLAPYGAHRLIGTGGKVRGHYRKVGHKRVHVKAHKRGYGLAPMYISRPYVGMGLLAPAGGQLIHRKGYYKKVGKRGHKVRIHVKPTVVHRRMGSGGNVKQLLLTLPTLKKKEYRGLIDDAVPHFYR